MGECSDQRGIVQETRVLIGEKRRGGTNPKWEGRGKVGKNETFRYRTAYAAHDVTRLEKKTVLPGRTRDYNSYVREVGKGWERSQEPDGGTLPTAESKKVSNVENASFRRIG